MTLDELIKAFRIRANDKIEPFLWSDEEVTSFLNDAQKEAAIRGRLIYDTADTISLHKDVAVYSISKFLYEISEANYNGNDGIEGRSLILRTPEEMRLEHGDNWKSKVGTPRYIAISGGYCRVAPIPEKAGSLDLEGYRLPIAFDLSQKETSEPEIAEPHHSYLVYWALNLAFSIPDSEVFDPQRAQLAEREFTQYFGLRPDSDLRAETSLNLPHVVKGFWP